MCFGAPYSVRIFFTILIKYRATYVKFYTHSGNIWHPLFCFALMNILSEGILKFCFSFKCWFSTHHLQGHKLIVGFNVCSLTLFSSVWTRMVSRPAVVF